MNLMNENRLPTSSQLAGMLRQAAQEQGKLQTQYSMAWSAAQIAKANATMARSMAAHNAYTEGRLDAKNEQMRQVQLDGLMASDEYVKGRDQDCTKAQADLKEAEGELENAKVLRGVLHDLVALRCSENGVEVAGWQSGLIYNNWPKGG